MNQVVSWQLAGLPHQVSPGDRRDIVTANLSLARPVQRHSRGIRQPGGGRAIDRQTVFPVDVQPLCRHEGHGLGRRVVDGRDDRDPVAAWTKDLIIRRVLSRGRVKWAVEVNEQVRRLPMEPVTPQARYQRPVRRYDQRRRAGRDSPAAGENGDERVRAGGQRPTLRVATPFDTGSVPRRVLPS